MSSNGVWAGVPSEVAPLTRTGKGLVDGQPLSSNLPLPTVGVCTAKRREARKGRNGRWYYRGTWDCVLVAGHEGVHRTEKTEGTHGGRKFSDADIERATRAEKKWKRLGSPQPPESIVGYKKFEEWVLRQVENLSRRYRRIHTVHNPVQLKEMVNIYLDEPEFAFDVETHAGRPVRTGQDTRVKTLSRYAEGTSPCLACGTPIPTRRRAYCSDLCRKAADKDKPALDTLTNEVWCISLACRKMSHVIPMGHPDSRKPQLHRTDVFEALHPLFFSERRKINQNVGFDLMTIAKYYGGQIPPPPYGDVMTLVFLINENLGQYNLGALSELYLGYKYSEKLGEEAYRVDFGRAMEYSVLDAKNAWLLWWKIAPRLQERTRKKLADLFTLEMKVLQVLMDMRRQGAYVDVEGFRKLRPILVQQLETIGQDIRTMVGHPINLNSTQQLGNYLYDELGLKCPIYTETNQRSTAAPALKILSRRHKAPRQILAYKDVSKLLSTYVAGFLPCVDDDDRIRASFNQAVAKTGRLSCSGPNLQNIPARYRANTEGTLIRRLFVAPPGKVLIVADYSQIELRILAHQTKDRLLLFAYREGLDLHLQTASLIYKVPQDKVDPEQRSIAKNSNFNLAFEGGPGRIVEMSGIPLREAEKVYEAWHQAYPGVRKWGKWIKDFCWERGYVETMYGRKRRLPEIKSGDSRDRHYAERQAVNHPIQGTAADIAKIGIIQVHEALQGYDAHLTLQIHDEFIIECAEEQVGEVIPLVKVAMEDIRLGDRPVLDIPLEVNIGVGTNWHEAK